MIERGLESGNGVLHATHAAEVAGGDLGRTTESVEGLYLHQLGQRIELQDAALDVAVEQQRQDFSVGGVCASVVIRDLIGEPI